MPIIHRWLRGATSVAWTAVTGGNRPVCTAGKSQWSRPTKRGSKNFNGLTGSPKFSCLGADSDSRSPQVHPTAVQADIALGNLSAGNSPGLYFISLVLPALPENKLPKGCLSKNSALSAWGTPNRVLLAWSWFTFLLRLIFLCLMWLQKHILSKIVNCSN